MVGVSVQNNVVVFEWGVLSSAFDALLSPPPGRHASPQLPPVLVAKTQPMAHAIFDRGQAPSNRVCCLIAPYGV